MQPNPTPDDAARGRLKRPLLGALIGFSLGICDVVVLRALGVTMMIDGVDWTVAIVTFFAINFAIMGAIIGHLLDQRRDIHRQHRVIADQLHTLRHTQRELVQSRTLAAIGRLASGVAHEVRNPLGVIRSSASMVLEDLPPEGDAAQATRFIREEVDRLSDFVGRLLDLARPIHPDPHEVPARELLEGVARAITHEGVDLEVDAPTDLTLHIDEELMHRLLLNLTTNALGAADAHVLLRALSAEEGVALGVVDDGPGIPGGSHETIFEPFMTTRAEGTGLGLPMAHKIAEAHGATLTALPGRGLRGGEGACLRVTLAQREVQR